MTAPSSILIGSVVVAMFGIPAFCEEQFREEFGEVGQWQARSDWLSAHAENPVVTTEEGIGHFRIGEANRGMKWVRSIEPVDCDWAPWLVLRYRAVNYATEAVDYVLWVGDDSRGGTRLLGGEGIASDGEWHTVALYLPAAGCQSPITDIAVQCFATDAGDAHLWVDYIAITDAPPQEAEGYAEVQRQTWAVEMDEANAWRVEPTWLANYADDNACERTDAGTEFIVGEGGQGAKWSRDLVEGIEGARWISMRYRAEGIRSSSDYAVYIANEAGGSAPQEQYVVRLSDLFTDGMWHVFRGVVRIDRIRTLAVQVQAAGPDAHIEIDEIAFHSLKPPVRIDEAFGYRATAWPAGEGYRAVSLAAGNVAGEELSGRVGYEGWLSGEEITAAGVPFRVRSGEDAAIMTPVGETGQIEMELSCKAAELYVLLAADLPRREEPSFGGGRMQSISQVERLIAEIEYGDESAERQFPYSVSGGRHAVYRGLGVYALALDAARGPRRVVLRDGMANGSFGLVAATTGEAAGPATEATRVEPRVSFGTAPAHADVATGIALREGLLRLESQTVSMHLDCRDGLRVVDMENRSYPEAPLKFEPGPLFTVHVDDRTVTSEQFRVEGVDIEGGEAGRRARVSLVWEGEDGAVELELVAELSRAGEVALGGTYDRGEYSNTAVDITFPLLRGLSFGGGPADTWYWMPRRGALINTIPIRQRQPYSGRMPMQIIGAFSRRAATGIYVMTQDLEGIPRYYELVKSGGWVDLSVDYAPCSSGRLARTVIGCNRGDWHEQLRRYQEWVETWYEPAAPRKRWFREVFNFRQQFLHFALPEKSGMFEPEDKTFHLREVVEQNADAFGGVDYLHLFDWGWDPVHGRCGDYEPWDYLGGADKLKRAIGKVKEMGIPVGLYIEGYLVDPESELGKAHGEDWQLLDRNGDPYPYFAPSYNMCPWAAEWQEYLAKTYARAERQTGAVGFYIDEYGFSDPNHSCYNEGHNHTIPVTPVVGERQMTRRVREAVGPECAVYTEESPTDVNSQYQDGSFTYAISQAEDSWSPHHLNLYRFAFPSFKTIEIIVCDKPLGSNVEAVKRILFNGEAIWIEGIWDKWFTAQTREYIAKMHRVLRENRRCFAGADATPLVGTLVEGVYANRFCENGDGSGATCWTIYNTNFRTVRGEIIGVKHMVGAEYVDGFSGEGIAVRRAGGEDILSLAIDPRDVTVVVRKGGND